MSDDEVEIDDPTEEIKPQSYYDFDKLNLQGFELIDPHRGPIKVLVPPNEARDFMKQCYNLQVQLSVYIEGKENGVIYKDKRKEMCQEKRIGRGKS